ncbi:MAG: c-type cytochrome [Planctomycetaceae bacterium]|nr:c-type cytochrome [Planctomycetaceae bacterium]
MERGVGFSRFSVVLVAALCALPAIAAEPSVKSPVSPADALQHFVLSPELDLRIALVAAEPEVIDPVAIAFDEHARMFVVEMRDYPNGPKDGEPPASRIRLLEDNDGDGRFETSHVFADGLLFATGVLPWDGGVIVIVAGEIRFLKDTDGDHAADVNEVWFSGFNEGNPQLRANHPTFGPDGWIYVANGLRGGKIKAMRTEWPAGEISLREIDLRDHDFRFNPRTGEAEAITGGGQFGMTFDAFGNRFICSNRNPCDHVVLELRHLEHNPHLAIGKPTQVVAAAGDDSRIFPLIDAWTTSTLHSGQFTAACGVKIFTGDALPPVCIGNAFTCEPTGSLVHREVLEPVGGTFRGTPGETNVEFLASRDPWFRPVNLTIGPDGALYVVDMYRAVIEHPEWMPEELRTRRDLRWGDDRGRIYRVAAKDKPPGKMPTLDANDSQSLAAAFDHPNGWMRDTAARLLDDDDALLEKAARNGATPEGRVRAMQLTNERDPTRINLIDDSDPRAVAAWLRNVAPYSQIHPKVLARLAKSPDARVRFETALAIGGPWQPAELHDAGDIESLAIIVCRDPDDRWLRIAALTSTSEPLPLFDAVFAKNADGALPFLVDLAELTGRRKQDAELAGLLDRLASTGPESGWALPILGGLAKGLGGSLEPALAAADDRTRRRLEAVFAWAAAIASDAGTPVSARVEAVRIVSIADRSFALPALLDLASANAQDVRLEVITALGRFRNDDRIAPALLADFSSQTPAVRSAVFDALLADRARATLVLEAVQTGLIAAAELGPTRIAALSKHPDPAVQALAKEVFVPPADRQQVLAEYQSVLSLKADANRGRGIFEKNCATCHRIGTTGNQVGPDIADSRVRTPEALLVDILDPNRAIDGRYVAYTIALRDGTVQTGLLTAETSNAVTLAQPDGKSLSILRSDIEEMHSEGKSLMPVGVERTIPPQEMADLIAFIKNWRYLDGAVPLGN